MSIRPVSPQSTCPRGKFLTSPEKQKNDLFFLLYQLNNFQLCTGRKILSIKVVKVKVRDAESAYLPIECPVEV